MNELEKPDKCSEKDCNNKAYKKDFITPNIWHWICRKHYNMYVLGKGECE